MFARKKICKQCGYVGTTKRVPKGNGIVELVFWILALCGFAMPLLLFFFGLALPYTFWRMASNTERCRKCSSDQVIPLDSPIGQEMQKNQESK